jgi:hypothetical protein
MSTPESINCLRCRHAKLLPHTDFSKDIVPILCKQANRAVPIPFEGCPIADPCPVNYRRMKNGQYRGGDRLHKMTRVENRYLRYHFTRSPMEKMCRDTGRKAGILRTICNNRMGLKRGELGPKLRGWPQEQRDYIRMCINSTFWPKRGYGAQTQRAQEIRDAIVEEVAKRGPRRTWLEIRYYAKSQTPAYLERLPRKMEEARQRARRKTAARRATTMTMQAEETGL